LGHQAFGVAVCQAVAGRVVGAAAVDVKMCEKVPPVVAAVDLARG
jgi:hypothetical protein